MEILKDIEILDTCLFLVKSNILIIPDVHIGYEEALNKQGILIPRTQFKDIMQNIEKIIKETMSRFRKINKIIIIGDLKHEFGTISETEWRQTLRFIDFLQMYCKDIVLLRGNHDTILGPIAGKRGIKIVDDIEIDRCLLLHGHRLPANIQKNIKTIIIGHEHPAITLRDGPRAERFKCFLKGTWKKASKRYDLIVLPSFNPLIEGTDVLQHQLLSPILKNIKISEFEVFIVGDKVYNFGKLKGLMKRKG